MKRPSGTTPECNGHAAFPMGVSFRPRSNSVIGIQSHVSGGNVQSLYLCSTVSTTLSLDMCFKSLFLTFFLVSVVLYME